MAIISSLPGIEATIRVNNIPLPEYLDDEDEDVSQGSDHAWRPLNQISKYIESAEGQEFSINFSLSPPYRMDCPALEITLTVDGHKIRGKLAERADYERKRGWSSYRAGVDKGEPGKQGVLRVFQFAGIKTSLDDDALAKVKDDAARISKVGEIVVEIYRNSTPVWGPKSKIQEGVGDYEAGIHEKALKGQPKYMGVSLGQGQTKRLSSQSAKSERLNPRPIARFRFKYRSRDALKQLLIIPRTPEPEFPSRRQSKRPVDLDGLDHEQLSQVKQIVRDMKQNGGSSNDSLPRIKREPDHRNELGGPSKRQRVTSNEVIDLTSD